MSGEDFIGANEVMRMERGQSYGLSRIEYWRLASLALACSKHAGIEPATINTLSDGPGCQLELYGKRFLFTVKVRPVLKSLTLQLMPLDAAQFCQRGGCFFRDFGTAGFSPADPHDPEGG